MDCLFNQIEWETGERPLLPRSGWGVQVKPVMGRISASEVKPGMSFHHRKTAAGSMVLEVLSIAVLFSGAIQFKCKGYSKQGEALNPSVTYRPDEEVEIVNDR